MSLFQAAEVIHQGQTFALSLEALESLGNHPSDWHGPGDPSTWLAVRVFARAKERTRGAPKAVALALASQALAVSPERLVEMIEWNENYHRMKDGDNGSPSILDY